MTDPQMAAGHARYYRHKARCDDLRRAIDQFLTEPTMSLGTLEGELVAVRDKLQRKADWVVAVWD